jgi:hypothetical protein
MSIISEISNIILCVFCTYISKCELIYLKKKIMEKIFFDAVLLYEYSLDSINE